MIRTHKCKKKMSLKLPLLGPFSHSATKSSYLLQKFEPLKRLSSFLDFANSEDMQFPRQGRGTPFFMQQDTPSVT